MLDQLFFEEEEEDDGDDDDDVDDGGATIFCRPVSPRDHGKLVDVSL